MRELFRRVGVPLAGVVAIFLITAITFATVKPGAFTRPRPLWTITGNAVIDQALFDGELSGKEGCAPLEDPVCGSDGKTYRNLCEARLAGVDARHRGPCQEKGWSLKGQE